jgi:hypothetical protein
MGYKAWIGGKSAWVSTKYGTSRTSSANETNANVGSSYEPETNKKYLFEMPNGTIRELSAPTIEGARNQAGKGAKLISKKKRKQRGD